jgi:uncharacterized membrane protein
MLMSAALALHILAATIWVGGMFFAYMCLRPVLGGRAPEERLQIWVMTFNRFFPWVFTSIGVLFLTGFLIIYQSGGFGAVGMYVYLMLGVAVVMTGIFKFIYVAPFRHLKRGLEEQNLKVASFALGTIRKLVAVNLGLGIVVIFIATGLKSWH